MNGRKGGWVDEKLRSYGLAVVAAACLMMRQAQDRIVLG